jgi:hypothetical protein
MLLIAFAVPVQAASFYAYERTSDHLVMVDSVAGSVTDVGAMNLPSAVNGGLGLDQAANLYWLGNYFSGGFITCGLFGIDKTTGNASLIDSVFSTQTSNTMDGFTIIGNTGYTIRHEQSNTLAQLYAIDLNLGTPTKIGTGYAIDGSVAQKTLGLTTDGVNLYGLRGSGQVEKVSLVTGQVESVIGSFGFTNVGALAYAENRFWALRVGSPENALYSLDPSDGTVTLVQDSLPAPYVVSLTSTSYPAICPDLVVDEISTNPSQPLEGQPVTLTVTVRNQGLVGVGPFYIDWYAHRASPPVAGQVGDARMQVSSLAAGASYEWDIDWVYDVGGDYTMAAQADTDNWIAECNEENNVLMSPLYVAPPIGNDTDKDGVVDEDDNCIEVSNPDQRDTDSDGYGNMCDGDLNNDGATNTLDLNLYKLAHRSALGDDNYNPDADFNGDDLINTLDLNIYKGLHRKPPGPSCCGLF